MAGDANSTKSNQFPVNLEEGLGVTALSYLVPTQDLAPLVVPGGLTPIPKNIEEEEGKSLYEEKVKLVINTNNSLYDTVRKSAADAYNFNESIEKSTLSFGGISTSLEDGSTSESRSLFDGLNGIARDIAYSAPLLPQERLFNVDGNGTSVAQLVNQIPKASQKRSSSIIMQAKEEVGLKKRKSDIGVHHLQLESISNQKLTALVVGKIGLSDEQNEYEASDLWIELPNSGHVLSDDVFVEIEQCLLKVIGTKLIHEISFEVLERIMKLAVRSIKSSENYDWADSEIQTDFWPLKVALNSLKAANLILIVFNTQRKEKRLYLDEELSTALDFIYKLVEDFIFKLTVQQDYLENENTKIIIGIMSLLIKNFNLFGDYIVNNQANDSILTKLEYLAVMVFFHTPEKNKFIVSLQNLKISSMKIITDIFKSKRDQRLFIVNEVLSNFDKLPTHKVYSRQVKLLRTTSIQLFTALMLNILQTLNIKNIELKEVFKEKQLNSSEFNLDNLSDEITEIKRITFENHEEKDNLLSIISSTLVSKLITQLNANTKQLFELFLQDLLNIVKYPEWPAAEQLLGSLTNTLVSNSQNQPSIVETYLLEMIGLIGSTMLELKGSDDLPTLGTSDLKAEYAAVSSYLLTLRNTFPVEYAADSFIFDWEYALVSDITSNDIPEPLKKKQKSTSDALMSSYYRERSNDLLKISDGNISEENAILSYKKILLCGNFMKLYQNFLNHLLKAIDHPKIKSRTRAMKNLAQLIDKDSRLLNVPMVKQSLSNRIADPSPLVRLAVLEIFDQCIFKKSELSGEFYQTLVLTNDKSISVRNKSLKIAKRIFIETDIKEIKVFALEKILRRLEDDEENVLEFAEQVLMELVFLSLQEKLSDFAKDPSKQRDQVSAIVDVLLDLINKSEKNWQLFATYLNDKVIRKTDENKKVHDLLIGVTKTMVEVLLSFVVDYMDSDKQNSVEQGLGLLSVFARCDFDLIDQEQLMSLQPYLTSDSSSSSAISYYTLLIFRNTLARTSSYRDQFLTDSQTSLLKKLTKFNIRELEEAMPCIWMISVMRNDTPKIANAAVSCLSLIKPHVDKALKDDLGNSDPKVLRLIYLIGSFGKYCDFECNREIFQKSKRLALKEKESVLSLITKYLLVFTRPAVHRQIRRVAVRNIISVCSTHPKLFMSTPILNVLDKEFNGSNVDFKEVMIQGILEFLEREEKKSLKRSGHEGKISSKVNIDVDVFHGNSKMFENDGICASLVQRFMDPILDMCIYDDGEHAYLAVKYLKFIVKLGFANPRICIPTVVALEASKIPFIRSIALEIHRDLHSKHESLIDSSYIHGLKLAVTYRAKLSSGMLNENQPYFNKFYKVIEESSSSKRKFFNQLVKSFAFNVDNTNEEDALFLKNYVLFIANSLPYCELANLDEVFTLVDGIDTVLVNQGVALSTKISQKLGQNNSDVNWKVLGYMSLAVIALDELKRTLIQAYKIPEVGQRNELKSQKTRYTEIPIQLNDIDPEAGSFKEICQQVTNISF